MSAVLEVVGPGSILLSNYIDGLDEGIKTVLIKFAGGTKLGGVVIALQDRNKIQNGLDSLRKWPYKIGINFNGDSTGAPTALEQCLEHTWCSANICSTFLVGLL